MKSRAVGTLSSKAARNRAGPAGEARSLSRLHTLPRDLHHESRVDRRHLCIIRSCHESQRFALPHCPFQLAGHLRVGQICNGTGFEQAMAYEPQAAVTLQEDALRRLWDLARAKRVPLFHRLPYEAIPVWKQVCDLILSHEAFRLSRLATLLLAPLALLQRNKDNIKQRLMRMVARPQLIIEAYYRAAQQDTEPEARRPRRDTSIEGAVERACALNPDKALNVAARLTVVHDRVGEFIGALHCRRTHSKRHLKLMWVEQKEHFLLV
jgi:hypothetical protein